MNILVCAACGYRASLDYVNMADKCPKCSATPFPEVKGETK